MKEHITHEGFGPNPQGHLTINCRNCDNRKCEKCISLRMLKRGELSEETARKFCFCFNRNREDHE